MAYRQILPITDPLLRQKSAPLDLSNGVTPEMTKLAGDLLDTTRAIGGAGMAAVQIGFPVRMFLLDLFRVMGDTIVFLNPEIVSVAEEKETMREGCLSMPDTFFEIERAAAVVVRYTDISGASAEYRAEGLAARCVLHELEHLDGAVMLDHLSPLKRAMALKQFAKQRAGRRRLSAAA